MPDASAVLVRPARRADIPAIVMVSSTSIHNGEDVGFGTPGSQSALADPERLAAIWEDPNLVRGEEILVAEIGGCVVGCVTVEERGDALELINIDVPIALQGRGIGTRMVHFVEERARRDGKRAVTLGTSRNAAGVAWKSLPWWQSRGYRITGEEVNDWTRAIGPGVREIRMRKDLAPSLEDILGGEVTLRDVVEQDLPIIFECTRDPEANYMAAFTAKDPTDQTAFRTHWTRILNDETVLAKAIVVGGRVVGHLGKFVDKDFGKPEVTYWIGKEYWGRGIATRALSMFLRELPTRPLYGRAAKDNLASIRVLEKCGFRIIGYDRGFSHARETEIEEAVLRLAE